MKRRIIVALSYTFEFNADDLDPKHVDIKELAKDCAYQDFIEQFENGLITTDDFYIEETNAEEKYN